MFRHMLLVAALSLGLTACVTPGTNSTSTSTVTPLGSTTIDEKALLIANQSADLMATAVDTAVAIGKLKPGSPTAVEVAAALRKLKLSLVVAQSALKAANATDYNTAIASAFDAAAVIQAALK